MWSVVVVSLIFILISFLVMGIGWMVCARSYSDQEKSTPFECGFDSLGFSRIPFSLRFFLLAVVFLIFDVEVVLLFPFISKSLCQFNLMLVGSGYCFLGILLVGLIHEWKEGSLDWAI
uniref:NADH-ubiquinone oxidoreductase chain 3 n=1 Tax=Cellana radiata TaxID=351208 RepID=A0A481MVJ0_9GAST|nr:NADH dehydrogenase subunit 3 [Cellana radiata]